MQDLKKESGLGIILKDDFKLELDISLLGGEFSSRTLTDMQPVLKDKAEPSDKPLYFMYRDVRERPDEAKIKENKLRYDLTVILPGTIGQEFNKTYGHYHPGLYPELYEVISGSALYLLQKPGRNPKEIIEAYLVEVKAGEKIIMPPGFGHVTINVDAKPLVMSNWVADEFKSEYEDYEKNQGGSFYVTKPETRNQKPEINLNYQIIKNKNYLRLPKLIKARPKELPNFGSKFGQPLYSQGINSINQLRFLVDPEKFRETINPSSVFNF